MPSLFLLILLLCLFLHKPLIAVVPEITWQLIVPWPRSGLIQHHVPSLSRGPKLTSQAVLGAGKAIAPLGRYLSVLACQVCPRTWNFVEVGCSLTASQSAAKMPNTAALVLCPKVLAVLADVKGCFILSWPRHHQLLTLIKFCLP